MVINGEEIKQGEDKEIRIEVSKLPSGTPIDIRAHVYRSKVDGPVILVMGGLHGDEVNGVEIVRRSITNKIFNAIERGTVIAIPLLNVYGFINFSREVPGGKDINRSFPGNTTGSLAAQVAKKLTSEILPHIDYGLDFHTGGASIYNAPQVRIYNGDARAVELADVFGTDYIIHSNLIAKSFRKESYKQGKSILVFEGGESLRLDELSIAEGIKGIKNILIHEQMIQGEINAKKSVVIKEGTWLRATVSGVFISHVNAGDKIKKGDVIGEITAPYGQVIKSITAKKDSVLYGLNNNPVVNRGDALYHIGI